MSEPHWETAEKVETANVDVREIRDLLEEIRRQNTLLKRYLFVFGAALALLLLMQFPVVSRIIEIVLVVSIVLAILLTAPVWSRGIAYVLDRLPWMGAWSTESRSSRKRDL